MAITKQRGQQAQPAGPGAPTVPITQSEPRRARRPMMAALALAVAVLGALGAYTMVNKAGNRVAVIAVATAIPKGQTITAQDLTKAEVAPDPALAPLSASDASQVIGKTAAIDLPAGSLLTKAAVQSGNSLTTGKTVVGVLAKPGMIPSGQIAPGDSVTVVSTPGANGAKTTGTPQTVAATVVSVGAPDSNENVIVNLATDPSDANQLAAWASTGNIAITVQDS